MSFFQPLWWEYIWCVSLLFSFLGLSAARKNRVKPMQQYIFGIIVFGYLPLIYAVVYYFSDVSVYLFSEDEDELNDVQKWQVNRF